MKKVLEEKTEDYWVCDSCEHDSLGEMMCPCPRGSCDALHMGEVVTKREIIFNVTEWLYQYLTDENIHYLVEMHPEEGIISELFFDTHDEYREYITINEITVKDE